jgi:hypothetical protein
MKPTEALQIIEGLARGLDATTGEVLPDSSPLSQPHVIRALFMAARALEQGPGKPARKADPPGNAGKPWSDEEDQRLMAAFDGGTSVAELAKSHERSRGAITSRLMRQGRLQIEHEGQPAA